MDRTRHYVALFPCILSFGFSRSPSCFIQERAAPGGGGTGSEADSDPSDPGKDPKRVKRILANRQSAQKSRMRKMQYMQDMEHGEPPRRRAMDGLARLAARLLVWLVTFVYKVHETRIERLALSFILKLALRALNGAFPSAALETMTKELAQKGPEVQALRAEHAAQVKRADILKGEVGGEGEFCCCPWFRRALGGVGGSLGRSLLRTSQHALLQDARSLTS